MNRTFVTGLVACAVGLASGATYLLVPGLADACGGLFGLRASGRPCGDGAAWLAAVEVFAATTLALTVLAAALLRTRRHDGLVGMADAGMAIGAMVALVEMSVYLALGSMLAMAYGALALALVAFAIRSERQTSMATALAMGFVVVSWAISDPGSAVVAAAPALLWLLAGTAYAASLKVEQVA